MSTSLLYHALDIVGYRYRGTLEKISFSPLNRSRARCDALVAGLGGSPNDARSGGDSWPLVGPSSGSL